MKKIIIIFILFLFFISLYSNDNCTILIFPFENRSNDYWDEEYGIRFAKMKNNKKVEFYRIIGIKKEGDKIIYKKENIGNGRIIKIKSNYAICKNKSDIKQGDRVKIIN